MKPTTLLKAGHVPVLLLLTAVLAGCLGLPGETRNDCWQTAEPPAAPPSEGVAGTDFSANRRTAYADLGFDGTTWPDLSGHTLTVLDHGAFDYAFGAAKERFENLTGARVVNVAADDAGTALQRAVEDREAGGGSFDILYGIDNVLMRKAQDAGIFDPYTPLGADRVEPAYRFIPTEGGAWLATPVDHGYIAVNGDPREDVTLESMDDLVDQAYRFVTQDPRLSSPGLGFLVATVATYGEDCYLGYWDALFENGLLVTTGWSEAYEQHFTGGYGQYEVGFSGKRPLVTSYTTSPAYEMFYGAAEPNLVLDAPRATMHQIQTMGILKGADRAAAEAWIEFTLSDDFQVLAAEYNAIYPVVSNERTNASVEAVYGGNDPVPGSFEPAPYSSDYLGSRIDGWVAGWVDLYESKRA